MSKNVAKLKKGAWVRWYSESSGGGACKFGKLEIVSEKSCAVSVRAVLTGATDEEGQRLALDSTDFKLTPAPKTYSPYTKNLELMSKEQIDKILSEEKARDAKKKAVKK